MRLAAQAGYGVFTFIAENPALSAILCCAALVLLCRVDGGPRPIFAFAAYCALAAAVYLLGVHFWGMGGLLLLAYTLALFPVIFGALWRFMPRFGTRRKARDIKEAE